MAGINAKIEVFDAVENGNETAADVADATNRSETNVRSAVNELRDEAFIVAARNGREFNYSVPDGVTEDDVRERFGNGSKPAAADPEQDTLAGTVSPATPGADAETGDTESGEEDSRMTVYRNYNWDDYKPVAGAVQEYIPSGEEVDEMVAQVAFREKFDHHPVFLLGGPTGCGKTTLAENLAAGTLSSLRLSDSVADALDQMDDHGVPEEPVPYFEVQVHDQMVAEDLFGSPQLTGGDTVWTDGPVTKALLASQEGPVVLCVDEVTRAPPQAKSALFDVLDHRCRVKLDGGRGGEVIAGKPENLIVIGTHNTGAGHYTEPMDFAEQGRWKSAWSVDYLGRVDADPTHETPEADLLEDATPAERTLAEELVSTANTIRDRASEADSPIDRGVPTRAVKAWAEDAVMFDKMGLDNPIVRAGRESVADVYFGEDGKEQIKMEVMEIIKDDFDGVDGTSDHDLMAGF